MDIKDLIILHNSAIEAYEELGVIDVKADDRSILMTNKGLENLFEKYGNDVSRVYTFFSGNWRKHIVFNDVNFFCILYEDSSYLTDLDKEVLEGNLI